MRVVAIVGAVALCVAFAAAKEEKDVPLLLGADDVDKKMAERLAPKPDIGKKTDEKVPPMTPGNIKGKLKQDRKALRDMKKQVSSLKSQMHDEKIAKEQRNLLKEQFKSLKRNLNSKKLEIQDLKHMKKEAGAMKMGHQGKRGGRKHKKDHRKGNKKDHKKIMKEDVAIEKDSLVAEEQLIKQQKKEMKKMARKEERREERKEERKEKANKRKDRKLGKQASKMLGMMETMETERKDQRRQGKRNRLAAGKDVPKLRSLDLPMRGHGKGHHMKRKSCAIDSDCTDGGQCLPNKKGHLRCRRGGKNMSSGSKCRYSEQCAAGLQCFKKENSIVRPGGRKTHRKRGICMDPSNADLTKGSFVPLKAAIEN